MPGTMFGQVVFHMIFHSTVKTTLKYNKESHPHFLGEKTDTESFSPLLKGIPRRAGYLA